MTELKMTEVERAERKERFRYVDLEHPLMKILFHLKLKTAKQPEPDA